MQGLINAFPDGKISAVRVFGAGDWGCCQFQFKGTNTEPLGGPDGSEAPPTGKVAEFPYVVVARFEAGVIAEFDEYFDRLEMLGQLGLAQGARALGRITTPRLPPPACAVVPVGLDVPAPCARLT